MRVSTGMIYDSGLAAMQSRTGTLLRTQQQLSTGRRILTPSDDPVAAARALEVTQSQAVNANQAIMRDNVKSSLGIIDGQLDSATDLMGRVRELAVQAGDAALSSADRRSLANELRARFQEMVGLANSRDGTGQYLFGGYQTNSQPFAGSVENGVTYGGDDGARMLSVSGSRQLAISDSGNDIFMRIKNGNGVFTTATQNEKPANATHITYEGANLTNPPATIGSFEIRFWTDTAGTVKTSGQVVGSVAIPANFVPAADQFDIQLDGAALPTTVTLSNPGPFATPADFVLQLQADLDTAVGAGNVTASLDVGNRLVLTSAAQGVPSRVLLTEGNGALAAMFGAAPAETPGIDGAAGDIYFDLVNSSGDSLFTRSASTTGGAANTYTHRYQSGTPIDLSSAGPFAFDYGADAVLTGTPADGDTFTVDRTAAAFTVTGKTFGANAARATIDAGTVSDPTKWQSRANSGDLEVRFWTDVQGTVTTSGQAVGTVVIPPALTIGAAADQFSVALDGGPAQNITLTPGTYATPAAFVAQLQTDIDGVVGAGNVVVSLDAANHLVLTSTSSGVPSAVTLGAWADAGMSTLFGTPAATAGITGAAGATYYDLVDVTTGKSLFTGGASTPGSTFTHAYTSGSAIALAGSGGPGQVTFDYGASVTISGIPAGGDAFTVKSDDAYYGNGYFVTAAKTSVALNTGAGIVGNGEVLDPAKWNQAANSRNLEVRFWNDTEAVPPVLYYDLVDAETEKSLFANAASTAGGASNTFTHKFVDGDKISFSGLNVPFNGTTVDDFGVSLVIHGTPASGDSFKVQASESTSVFETMAQLIGALEEGKPSGTLGNTHLSNQLATVLSSISQIEDNFLRVRASIGSRLAEVEDLDTVGQNLDLQYSETLSRLQDLDYADAITRLTRQQMELQASQESFARVSQLSLFQYL